MNWESRPVVPSGDRARTRRPRFDDLESPIVVLTGAGISTASGIPDYRGKDGLWERYDPDGFTIDAFLADPVAFWQRRRSLTRDMAILEAAPNVAHETLAEATVDGRIAHIITQNIDGLHRAAGSPAERLLEIHGNAALTVCMDCAEQERTRSVFERLRPDEAPRCLACQGYLKPDVVLFGEVVPGMDDAVRIVDDARTLVAVGTSLQVWPVAGLVELAHRNGAMVIVLNQDATPFDRIASYVDRGPAVESVPALFS